MTIRNLDNYVNSLWDWGFLDSCFGNTRIRVTDADGLVERNCHFLLIEAKGCGVPIPRGQVIMFDNMKLAFGDRFHILVVWGYTNKPTECQLWGFGKMEADESVIKDIVSRWFDYASRQPRLYANRGFVGETRSVNLTKDMLAQVSTAVHEQYKPFVVQDIYAALDCKYDSSLVRAAIWYMIEQGWVDITQDRRFVCLAEEP